MDLVEKKNVPNESNVYLDPKSSLFGQVYVNKY